MGDFIKVRRMSILHRGGIYDFAHLDIVPTHVEHIDNPYGGFDFQHYKHRVEVCVSPTGRSVQIHVDGKRWVPTQEIA